MLKTTPRATGTNKKMIYSSSKGRETRLTNIKTNTSEKIDTMEKELDLILDPISQFLESQPNCFRQRMKTIAISLLDCADTKLGKEKTLNRFSTDSDYIPSSARFKFKLTCSKELTTDPRFAALSKDCADGIQTLQKLLKSRVHDLLRLETTHATESHLTTFISTFHIFAQGLTIRHLERNKKLNVQMSINAISLVALKSYIHDDITNLTNYFGTDKHSIFKHFYKITNQNKITSTTTTNNKNSDVREQPPPPINRYKTTNVQDPKTITDSGDSSPISDSAPAKNSVRQPSTSSSMKNNNDEIIQSETQSQLTHSSPTTNTNEETQRVIDLSQTIMVPSSQQDSDNGSYTNDNLSYRLTEPTHNKSKNDATSITSTITVPTQQRLFQYSPSQYDPPSITENDRNPFEQILSDINKEKARASKKKQLNTNNKKTNSASPPPNSDSSATTLNTNDSTPSINNKIPKKKRNLKTSSTHHNATLNNTIPNNEKSRKTTKTTKIPTLITPKHKQNPTRNKTSSSHQREHNNTSPSTSLITSKQRQDTTPPTPQKIDDNDTDSISVLTDKSYHLQTHDDNNNTIAHVRDQLHNIIPQLSYQLFNFHASEQQDSQADAAVLAFWEANNTNTNTTKINLSLEKETNLNQETIATLISNTCKSEIKKSLTHRPKNSSILKKHPHFTPATIPPPYHTDKDDKSFTTLKRKNFVQQHTSSHKKLKWTPPQYLPTEQQTQDSLQYSNIKKIKRHNQRMQWLSSKQISKNFRSYHNNATL